MLLGGRNTRTPQFRLSRSLPLITLALLDSESRRLRGYRHERDAMVVGGLLGTFLVRCTLLLVDAVIFPVVVP